MAVDLGSGARRVAVTIHMVSCFQLATLDLFLRRPPWYASHPRGAAYLVASGALFFLVASTRVGRAWRVVVALALGLVVTAQLAFYRYFHAVFDDQAAVAARVAWTDVRPVVVHAAPALIATTLAIAALEAVWLSLVAPRPPPARRDPMRAIACVALVAGVAIGGPLRDATAEVRAVDAGVAFLSAETAHRHRAERVVLPPLESRRPVVPNVLFVVSESIRASSFCADIGEPCPMSPELAALLPSRVPLLQMRAVASYTAVSMSVLLTGLPQTGPHAMASAPNLFDFVRATRSHGVAATVHYWSAHKSNFFERAAPRADVDSFVDAEEMLGHPIEDVEEAVASGLDRRLADECARRLPALRSPYVAVVHFSGTHAPYFFDEATAPFRPFGRVVTWTGLKELERSYMNAIVEQDRSVARCVKAFLDAQGGAPHLVVYTSDHGESFGEHSAIHHGQNLYDEQLRVPAFVYAGGGALPPAEAERLESARGAYVTHYDLLPTILDALGVLDHVALSIVHAPTLAGRSLLRSPPSQADPLPITNCTPTWPCPLNVWGMLDGRRKLTAQAWDGAWRCLDLEGAEHEVPMDGCDDLLKASRLVFPTQPNGNPNR